MTFIEKKNEFLKSHFALFQEHLVKWTSFAVDMKSLKLKFTPVTTGRNKYYQFDLSCNRRFSFYKITTELHVNMLAPI